VIHHVPEDTEIVCVDGVCYAREIFKLFADNAKVGTIFQFIKKDEDGTVTLTQLPAAASC
jgi:hypothetical protein